MMKTSALKGDGTHPGAGLPDGGNHQRSSRIEEAYRTGRGKVYIRARAEWKLTLKPDVKPLSSTKFRISEQSAPDREDCGTGKRKTRGSISALRDESDKDGMRIVIEVNAMRSVKLCLTTSTPRPSCSFFRYQHGGIAPWSAEDHEPEDIIAAFVRHRREVVTRRTISNCVKLAIVRISLKH